MAESGWRGRPESCVRSGYANAVVMEFGSVALVGRLLLQFSRLRPSYGKRSCRAVPVSNLYLLRDRRRLIADTSTKTRAAFRPPQRTGKMRKVPTGDINGRSSAWDGADTSELVAAMANRLQGAVKAATGWRRSQPCRIRQLAVRGTPAAPHPSRQPRFSQVSSESTGVAWVGLSLDLRIWLPNPFPPRIPHLYPNSFISFRKSSSRTYF